MGELNGNFKIPYEIHQKLIPSTALSIYNLLQHTFPPFSNTELGHVSEVTFFSCTDPDEMDDDAIARLQHLPIPSPKYICSLVKLRDDVIEAGFQSIAYKHLQSETIQDEASNGIYPLWVLTFWEETVKAKGVVLKWVRCRDWLTIQMGQKKSSERRSLAQKASIALTTLPWGQSKPLGLADTLPIHGLWRYLGPNYLSCSEIEDALKLIRTDLFYNPEMMASTLVEGTPFIMFLLEAYRNRDEYENDHALAWLRKVGYTLVASNGRLATVTSLEPITHEQHWVALLISEGGKKIQYGDSLAREIPHHLREVVVWWIQYHAPTSNASLSCLPIISQTDGHSCGILAVVALREALALPPQHTSRDPAALRLDLFNRVSNEILIRLSAPEDDGVGANLVPPTVSHPTVPHPKSDSPPQPEVDTSGVERRLKRKLTDYWAVETVEETQARNHREFERVQERWEEMEVKKGQQELQRQAQRTKANCEAQRKCRQLQRDKRETEASMTEKSDDSLATPHIVPPIDPIRTPDPLNDTVHLTFPHPSIAEISRPRRQFKLDLHKTKKPMGRKSTKQPETSQRTNWFMPLIWLSIEQAVIRAGKPWSPRSIMREAKALNPVLFENLREQVIGRWIDKEAMARGESRWLESVLQQVKRNNPGGQTTRVGILASYPNVQDRISFQLTSLREAGVALTLVTIRAIMIAIIEDMAPEIYAMRAKDGSQFKCSESFVRKFLHKAMGWSERRATKAAQKLPANHPEILRRAFLREGFIIRDYSVPAALRVNTDQTQLVYQQGSDKTWNASGVKQVATVGQEEKRAFTLVPSISASGELLPMQAIFMGKTSASCPSTGAPGYERAQELGFQMLPSMTSTYWSTQETMQILVDTIIAPYFDHKKKELGLPPSQHSIWKIDCWSVHRSESFRKWMKEKHSNIIIVYVPGGCTSLWQPLDVGIQRVLKLSMRRSAHWDIVTEVSNQIENCVDDISIDTTLGTLRNRSVQWIVNAIDDITCKQLILKAFEMCRASPDWNLSHESLTSPSALEALRNLPRTDKELYDELCGFSNSTTPHSQSQPDPEVDESPFTECPEDHSDVPVSVLINAITGQSQDGFSVAGDSSLERSSMAESETNIREDLPVLEGRSKRVRKARVPFGGLELWYEH